MATEGPVGLATWSDDAAVGTLAWDTPTNTATSDDARTSNFNSGSPTFSTVKWVVAGTVSGSNLASGQSAQNTGDTTITFGSTSSTAGLTLTGADIKASNFGCVIQVQGITGSHYLKGLQAAFSTIGDSDTVNGLELIVEFSGAFGTVNIDTASVRATYTAAAAGQPTGKRSGGIPTSATRFVRHTRIRGW